MKSTRLLWRVILAHLLFLALLILLTSSGRKKFKLSQVTPVSLLETAAPEAAPPKAEIKAPPKPEIKPPPEKAPPPPKNNTRAKPRRKKITKRISEPVSYSSRLKNRLRERLSRIQSSVPRTAPAAGKTGLKSRGFRYTWYNSYLSSKILNLWIEPSHAAVGKDQARALVSFRVYRDGHIESVTLKNSSGSKIMDDSVLRAVRAADPLPPFPENFKRAYHDFELLFKPSQQSE